jgi:NhaP-type Na+/H+ or K+/H+ antiporter
LGSGWIKRLPLSDAIIYLFVGVILGPYGVKLIQERPGAEFLEHVTEFVVLVSLFGCGLRINRPLNLGAWNSTIRLIGFLMPISIFAVAAVGHWLLGIGWGAAILLGAILAPTDPVLASEVQISDVEDQDELRFGLTSEGGLNDALAFPFVYFGLHWLEDNNWQNWFKQWVAVDLIWAIAAGIIMGIVVAKTVVWIDHYLQDFRPVDEIREDFVALSTILLTYSLTELVNGYGFLAVFVAGLVIKNGYYREKHLSQLMFTEQIEKFAGQALLVAGLLLLLIRPIGAWISTIGVQFHPAKRWLMGWFGIRGVGSLYYLFYALGKGLKGELGEQIAWITYITVVISVVVHGISSTPLMNWYERHIKGGRKSKDVSPATSLDEQ